MLFVMRRGVEIEIIKISVLCPVNLAATDPKPIGPSRKLDKLAIGKEGQFLLVGEDGMLSTPQRPNTDPGTGPS